MISYSVPTGVRNTVISMSVCLSVRTVISEITCPNFIKFPVCALHLTVGLQLNPRLAAL